MTTVSLESRSPDMTTAFAAALGAALPGGTVVLLSGDLGAGKTCFVRGLARGLTVPPGVAVTSPTFVLQHVYRGGRRTLYHIDAYRLHGGAEEFEGAGLQECLGDAAGIVCIEWPEKLPDMVWPAQRIDLALEHVNPQTRRIAAKTELLELQTILELAVKNGERSA